MKTRKALFTLSILFIMALMIAGCGKTEEYKNETNPMETEGEILDCDVPSFVLDGTYTLNEITFSAPISWFDEEYEVPVDGLDGYMFTSPDNEVAFMVVVYGQPYISNPLPYQTELDSFMPSNFISNEVYDITVKGYSGIEHYGYMDNHPSRWICFYTDKHVYSFYGCCSDDMAESVIGERGLFNQIITSFCDTDTVKFTSFPPRWDESIRDWVAQNGKMISLEEISNSESRYIMLDGLAIDVQHFSSSKSVLFDVCQKSPEGYKSKFFSLDYEKCVGAESIAEGTGVLLYGYIGEDVFYPIYIEPTEVDFTLEDIVKEYKESCESFDYKMIARDPELYRGRKACFTGKVIQVLENGNNIVLRVNVTKGSYTYEDTIYVNYTRENSSESRILEDDIITMYGSLAGLETYKTVLGGSITIPKIYAEYIELIS